MKTITLSLIAALALVGCASGPKAFISNTQFHRIKGQDNQLMLEAAYILDKQIIKTEDNKFILKIDGKPHIAMKTTPQGNGDISCTKDTANTTTCSDYEGLPLSASCIGSTINNKLASVNCTVFIDNERAATFRF